MQRFGTVFWGQRFQVSKGFNVSANWRRSGKPGQEQQSPGPQKTRSATQASLSYRPARLVYRTGLVIQPKISEKLQKYFNKFQFPRWVCRAGLPGLPTGPDWPGNPARQTHLENWNFIFKNFGNFFKFFQTFFIPFFYFFGIFLKSFEKS